MLLINDVALKWLWPEAWVTGKLSDLAWVVFASPLLAFALSFLAREHPLARRAAFVVAYLGLPLLYAAFNTFEPLHDWILRALSLASGRPSASPLDATDTIVIPFGLAIALWVWNRPPAGADSLRMRLVLLTAAVAAIATVATSPPDHTWGITRVGIALEGPGLLAAGSGHHSIDDYYGYSLSDDGGMSWDVPWNNNLEITWGKNTIDTPRGFYSIVGANIYRNVSGERGGMVYDTELDNQSNLWVQEVATRDLYGLRAITKAPYSITYDPESGNVVAVVGLMGVVVGSPDGKWTPVAVGGYSPLDFSLRTKLRLIIAEHWSSILVIALSFSVCALIVSECRREDIMTTLFLILAPFIAVAVIFTYTGPHMIVLGAIFIIAIGLLFNSIARPRKTSTLRKVAALISTSFAMLLPFLAIGTYRLVGEFTMSVWIGTFGATLLAAILLGGAAALYWPRRDQLVMMAGAFMGNLLLIMLVLTLWIFGLVGIHIAILAGIALLSLSVLAQQPYLRREPPPEPPDPWLSG